MKSLVATTPGVSAHEADVLTKALVRAAARLGLSQKTVSSMLGVSEASVSRLARGRRIAPDTKEGELAVVFLRLWRSLDALLGGNAEQCRQWMNAENVHLGGVPATMIRSVEGLVRVGQYLDALRGKS